MTTRRIVALGLAVAALAACGGGGGDTAAPAMEIQGARALARPAVGAVEGNAGSGTLSFLGIPYAQAPVGPLRWMPPVAAAQWPQRLDATRPARHCPQENDKADAAASENCLYLNVYAPRSAAGAAGAVVAKKPVMVWLYGGANAYGASDFYDPSAMVERGDVLVVTLNYRVGALGFLTHPALRAGGNGSANYGVQDQQLALRWVRDNIAAFGGDAANVTLFGESAGGLNATTHLVSPGSANLFHKAIIQSGAYLLETPPRDDADARAAAFAGRLGCGTSEVAACLRGKSVADILNAQGTVNTDGAAYRQMVLDGVVLPEQQANALAAGRFHKVPVLLGSNANEGNLFFGASTTPAQYLATVNDFSVKNHRDPAQTLQAYPLAGYASAMAAASAVLGDAEFSCPARRTSGWFAAHVPTYAYEFADPASLAGSGHFAEIYYLFDFKGQQGTGLRGPARSQALAATMQGHWTHFARTGDPNGAGLPAWARTTVAAPVIQPLSPQGAAGLDTGTFATRHQCGYWG